MYKIRLVLVDDHILFTEGLSAALSKEEDMKVIATFSDARKALKVIETITLDLLITDISMPEMNGVEFIKKIKEKKPTLKILVVSMFQQIFPSKKIHGYITKDTDLLKFANVIRTIVINDEKYFEENDLKVTISEFNTSLLTKREKEIVQLIGKEYTVNEISQQLFISRLTVESHKKNIFHKLNVKTNAGLIKIGMKLGYLN